MYIFVRVFMFHIHIHVFTCTLIPVHVRTCGYVFMHERINVFITKTRKDHWYADKPKYNDDASINWTPSPSFSLSPILSR